MIHMKTQLMRSTRTALALAVTAALVACASAPTSNPKLDAARAAYDQTAADPQVVSSAPVELRQAQDALAKSEAALRKGDDMTEVEHFAYLARQRTEVARQAGLIAQADAAVAASRAERDRILIEARTNEAQVQRDSAERARLAAASERNAAEAARMQAEEARLQAEASRAQADASRTQADAARTQADAARRSAQEQLAAARAARQLAEAETVRAAKLEAQMAELQAKQTNRGMVLTLGDVLFDTGLATLKAGAMRTVDQLATFLQSNPERKVLVEGHTDSVGSDSLNRELSERRAQALSQALVERQIAADRVQASGLGENYPVADNSNAAGRQQNRRVEVIFSDADGRVKARN